MLRSFPLGFHKGRFFASYVSNNILLYSDQVFYHDKYLDFLDFYGS